MSRKKGTHMQTVEQKINSVADDGLTVPMENGQSGEDFTSGSDAGSQEDARREWEELISSPKFHALYQQQVSEIVRKRLKSERQSEALLQSAAQLLGLENPEQLPERLAQMLTPAARDWQSEEAAVKQKYPEFDLAAATENPLFAKLLKGFASLPEISLTSLYELLHLDSLKENAAREAANKAASQLLGAMQSRHARPHENGLHTAFADAGRATHLTRAQRAVLAERAAKGEHITF